MESKLKELEEAIGIWFNSLLIIAISQFAHLFSLQEQEYFLQLVDFNDFTHPNSILVQERNNFFEINYLKCYS
jgi:ABC-type metal ion transport system substrate-binding protein